MKYFIILFFISSCAIHHKFDKKRASRKIRKAEKLDPSRFSSDTVFIRDTVVFKSYEVDTVSKIIYHDTVKVVDNSRVILKYFYDTLRQEIWHEVDCKGDTVFLEHTVTSDIITPEEKKIHWGWLVVILIVVLLIVLR